MSERDLWNERYRQKSLVWGKEPNQFVVERLSGLEPCRVLDLGCGEGRNAIWLAVQGHDVTGVDVSDVAISRASDIAEEIGVPVAFMAADVRTWEPEPESFDLVVLAYMQAPPQIRPALHEKVARALVPGGRVFLIAHHKDNASKGVGGPPMHVLFDEDELAADFSGFNIAENTAVLRRVENGEASGDAVDLLFDASKPLA